MSRRALSLTMTSALALGLISVGPTRAQEVIPTNDIMPLSVAERMGLELRMSDLERKLREQQAQLDSQGEILRRQEALITRQAAELSRSLPCHEFLIGGDPTEAVTVLRGFMGELGP